MYVPLGGSQEGKWKSIRNIFIIFLVSGFWHGSNWTFIFWGLFHSILFLPSFIFNTNRKYTSSIIAENTTLPSLKELIQVGITFISVTIGWVFFRSETIGDSFNYLNQMLFEFNFSLKYISSMVYVNFFLLFDFFLRKDERNFMDTSNKYFRRLVYIFLFIITFSKFFLVKSTFIYFQF